MLPVMKLPNSFTDNDSANYAAALKANQNYLIF
ncbi:hypothetical protein J5U23_00190 [Saccharolobus shibatae B12]|uniref:Uncharacterized protein n=2 Tax=Saccharolobus shibatae TaxID=2286 RepID=A0A8F5BLF3_SACSH|nr:hypothetical protein J5U23_00190 [Saccharolobus shibatae B12]QXJ30634.1 hypothetical protein J5U21_00281 [Saccharolobus shibatae]